MSHRDIQRHKVSIDIVLATTVEVDLDMGDYADWLSYDSNRGGDIAQWLEERQADGEPLFPIPDLTTMDVFRVDFEAEPVAAQPTL